MIYLPFVFFIRFKPIEVVFCAEKVDRSSIYLLPTIYQLKFYIFNRIFCLCQISLINLGMKSSDKNARFLTTRQAAIAIDCSVATIINWCNLGKIEYKIEFVGPVKKIFKVDMISVRNFISAQRKKKRG